MKPTIKDVARRAGVCISTVSSVINNKETVSEKLKRRVTKAIDELQYKPDQSAQRLAKRERPKSSFVTVIGLSMPHYISQGPVVLAAAVKHRAIEREVQVIEYLTENNSQRQIKQIREKIQRRVDAIICFPVDYKEIEGSVNECNIANIPFVSLNRFASGDVYATVKADDYNAGSDLALYLAFELQGKKGKILEIQGEVIDFNSTQRSAGFNDVIRNWPGLKAVCKYRCSWDAQMAKKATIQTLGHYPDINVIYAHNDEMAKGALEALEELGRVYPVGDARHVVVLGVDADKFALDNIRRGLMDATSEGLLWEQGIKAVDLAVTALSGEVIDNPVVLIRTILITRHNVDFVENHWAEYDIDLTPAIRKEKLGTSIVS